MNGWVLKDTPIAVDFWQVRQLSHVKIFFLSHMHGDHTKGLSGSWRRPIYCSPVTARLLPAKLKVPASLVRPLEVGESHIIPLDETGQETMTVSLIDANHCPGAVMFLFEGYFGRILYTGDFRYQPSMITETILSNCGQIDKLYLDNTYNNPKCVWPRRPECTAKIIDIISQYPAYEIVIGVHKLGKEELLVAIALAMKMRIVVNPDRMQTMKILELPDVFTTDSSQSRLRAVPNHLVTRKNVSKWQEGAPTIAILPTALYTSLDMEPYADHPDIHVVPYSDHSSYSELIEFVSRIKPKSITPVVGASRFDMGNGDMSEFDPYLTKSAEFDMQDIRIPESVLRYMNTTTTLCEVKNVRNVNVKHKQLRKTSSKDLPKGVVFNDNIDEDLTEEMERRRKSEEQRHVAVSPSQNEQSCTESDPQTRDLSHSKAANKVLPKGVVFNDNINEDLMEESEKRKESEQQRHVAKTLSQNEQSELQTVNLSQSKDANKDLQKGVGFHDSIDVDLIEESERRREREQQRQVAKTTHLQSEQSCKETELLASNLSHSKDSNSNAVSASDEQNPNSCQDSPNVSNSKVVGDDVKPGSASATIELVGSKVLKPCHNSLRSSGTKVNLSHSNHDNEDARSQGVGKKPNSCKQRSNTTNIVSGAKRESVGSPVLKPSQNNSVCENGANVKPPKRPKMDVYSMLLASAYKRKDTKSGDDDVIIIDDSQRTTSANKMVNDRTQGAHLQQPANNGPSVSKDQPAEKEHMLMGDKSHKTTLESSGSKSSSEVICIEAGPSCSVPTHNTGVVSKMNTSRPLVNRSVSDSGFLKLPCSIRPKNKKRKRLNPADIYKNFLQK